MRKRKERKRRNTSGDQDEKRRGLTVPLVEEYHSVVTSSFPAVVSSGVIVNGGSIPVFKFDTIPPILDFFISILEYTCIVTSSVSLTVVNRNRSKTLILFVNSVTNLGLKPK